MCLKSFSFPVRCGDSKGGSARTAYGRDFKLVRLGSSVNSDKNTNRSLYNIKPVVVRGDFKITFATCFNVSYDFSKA